MAIMKLLKKFPNGVEEFSETEQIPPFKVHFVRIKQKHFHEILQIFDNPLVISPFYFVKLWFILN